MKIYNKSSFFSGLFFLATLVIFMLDIVHADWWQWIICFMACINLLYIALSKDGSRYNDIINQKYKETAVKLYGKYYMVKTNLPIIIIVVFLLLAYLIRVKFDFIIPIWGWFLFIFISTVATAYSIGLDRSIKKYIGDNIKNDDN